jgi:predicted aconitase
MPKKRDNVSELQQEFMDRVLEAGGRPAVVTTVNEALMVLDGVDEVMRRHTLRVVANSARLPYRRAVAKRLRR